MPKPGRDSSRAAARRKLALQVRIEEAELKLHLKALERAMAGDRVRKAMGGGTVEDVLEYPDAITLQALKMIETARERAAKAELARLAAEERGGGDGGDAGSLAALKARRAWQADIRQRVDALLAQEGGTQGDGGRGPESLGQDDGLVRRAMAAGVDGVEPGGP